MSAFTVSKECASYIPAHKGMQWLKDHAEHPVEIIGNDGDKGLLKVYKIKSLLDGTIGTAWSREIKARKF